MFTNKFGKETSLRYSNGLADLPPILVNVLIEGKGKVKPESISFLEENDPTFTIKEVDKYSVFQVERILNTIELIELLSYINGLRKKTKIQIDGATYQYGTFRGAIYSYMNGNRVWSSDIGAGFHSKSEQDILETKDIFEFLLSKSS